MKKWIVILPRILAFAGFVLTLSVIACWAEKPTLGRLAYWVPPQRMAEFEAVYEEQIAPILKRHGLVESVQRGRATEDNVFSRLFEFGSASELMDMLEVLGSDSQIREDFGEVWPNIETTFYPAGTGGLQPSFGHYATLAGSGRKVPAGSGKVISAGRGTGHWVNYNVTDGLAGLDVTAIIKDRQGHLWFGTDGSGVSRYDGYEFKTFNTQDGLVHNGVRSILEDREGILWFSTLGGVSRYDGQDFTTFTTQDGLAHNSVWSILEDREGHLWFGSHGGVSRYDGQEFITFTTKTA